MTDNQDRMAQEREAFEKRFAQCNLARFGSGYVDDRINDIWIGWQAHASAQPAQPASVGDAIAMQPELPPSELYTLIGSTIATLQHARVFIVSREKMAKIGVELYDDLI